MKIGPDGSLCRITSSFKNLVNNIRIIKVPDSLPSYKLIVIRPDDDHEELSEKSDEEISDNELFDFKFPTENIEKEKIVDTQIVKPNETVSEGIRTESNHYNKCRPNHKRNNRYFDRRKNFNKISKNKSFSNMEGIYNYGNRDFPSANRDFSSANRDFSSSANQDFPSAASRDFPSVANRDFPSAANREFPSAANREFPSAANREFPSAANQEFPSAANREFPSTSSACQDFGPTTKRHTPYNTDNYQHSSGNISPWIGSPIMLPNYSHASFSCALLPEKPRKSFALLGDRPSYLPPVPTFQPTNLNDNYVHDQNLTYNSMASNFQSNSMSDNFICDQTSPYPPRSLNFASNNPNFVHSQNSPYSQMASNYPSSKKTGYWNNSYTNYNQNKQLRSGRMNNKHKQNTWNKKSRRRP